MAGDIEAVEVGAALGRMRRLARMTQAEVARAMGTTQSAVSRAETGRLMPSMDFLQRFAWATGRMLSMDVGPPARMRSERPPPIDGGEDTAARVRRARERVDRGQISVAEYATERLLAELELAEQRTAPI